MSTTGFGTLSKQDILSAKINGLSMSGRRPASHANVTTMLMMMGDILCVLSALPIALALGLEHWLGYSAGLRDLMTSMGPQTWHFGYLLWFIVSLLFVMHHYGLYGQTLTYSALNEQRKTVQACLVAGLLLCGAMYMMHYVSISRVSVIDFVCLSTIFLCISRVCWRYRAFRRYERGVDSRNVIVLGASSIGLALYRQIQRNRHLGRVFKGFVEVPGSYAASMAEPEHVIGTLDQMRYLARMHFIDEIIIAESCSVPIVLNLVDLAREMGIEVLVIPGFYDGVTPEAPIEYLGDYPVVAIHRRDERAIATLVKRIADVTLSSIALALLLPVLLMISLCIKLDSSGPVFYAAERIGKKGRVFRCFKFRTMVMNAEHLKASLNDQNERKGILFKIKNDPRVTRVGRILRKYSLDELPQFLNVLRGEMSMVGPRPPIASEVKQYEMEHLRRLEVLPGVTGLWQVRARQDPSFERYVALDLAYVENWSLWLDLKILIRTAEVVFRGTGS